MDIGDLCPSTTFQGASHSNTWPYLPQEDLVTVKADKWACLFLGDLSGWWFSFWFPFK